MDATKYAPIPAKEYQFQPSSIPKDGCNAASGQHVDVWGQFQASSIPKDGCNMPTCRVSTGE